jgi:hypothetical protein
MAAIQFKKTATAGAARFGFVPLGATPAWALESIDRVPFPRYAVPADRTGVYNVASRKARL